MNNLSPAQRNRLLLSEIEASFPNDFMAIACFITPDYEKYVPLWKKCIHEAYPHYEAVVIRDSDMPDAPKDPNKFAASRFLLAENLLDEFPYVLITDADIMIMPESKSILFQHFFWMRKHSLKCYSNSFDTVMRPSGVHFFTHDWWETTREARAAQLEALEDAPSTWGMDELILGKVVIESGLPVVNEPVLWNHHGVHLGQLKRTQKVSLTGPQSVFLEGLLNSADGEMLELIKDFKRATE